MIPDNLHIPVPGVREKPLHGGERKSLSKRARYKLQIARKWDAGFSLTELVVALGVALVLAGIGLPTFLRAFHSYQLTNAANQVADILRLTRYEAIRLNTPVNCIIQTASDPTMTNLYSVLKNGTADPGQKSILLQSSGNIISGGMPAGLQTAANTGTLTLVAPSATVQFDARGAVVPTGQLTVFYLANTTTADPGFRAVILMPAGSIQIWTSDATGNWQQIR
jgi:prepilin-type N-terminal cleavage/methylation domain-containing protein